MKLSKEQTKVIANKILDALHKHGQAHPNYPWRTTSQVTREELGLTVNQQVAIRRVLNLLLRAGKLKHRGTSSIHAWCINVTEWNRFRPFDFPYEEDLIDVDYYNSNKHLTGGASETPEEGDTPDTESQPFGGRVRYPKTPKVTVETVATNYENDSDSSSYDDSELQKRVRQLEDEVEVHKLALKTHGATIKELQEKLSSQGQFCKTLDIKLDSNKIVKLKNVVLPSNYEKVLDLAKCRRPILLVGPAGCGKTHLAELIAKSLDLDFDAINLTAGIAEHHLIGKNIPNLTTGKEKYHSSPFVDRYENGGVFLADEIDAADPNVLMCINAGLSNRYLNLPRQINPKAAQHKDFIMIATANTFGRGADRVYAGRNQIDEATLDRFRMGTVECDYDASVEAALCPDEGLRTLLQGIRKKVVDNSLRRVVSTRFMADAYVVKKQCKWGDDQILQALTSGWNEQERRAIK